MGAMTTERTLYRSERELDRLTERIGARGLDLGRTRRRLRWRVRLPRLAALALLAAIALLLWSGLWEVALALALLWLPECLRASFATSTTDAPLVATEDFLAQESRWLEKQVLRERARLLVGLAGSVACVALAVVGTNGAAAFWLLAALTAGKALVRFLVLGPALARELADLGGRPPGGWALAAITATIVLLGPVLVLGGLLAHGLRRLLGRGAER